jgi:hypothetical protein
MTGLFGNFPINPFQPCAYNMAKYGNKGIIGARKRASANPMIPTMRCLTINLLCANLVG